MAYTVTLIIGVVLGLALRSIPAFWRAQRRAQAAASQDAVYADGAWFPDTTPPPPLSQAQIADRPTIGKISFRSRPGRRVRRTTGR